MTFKIFDTKIYIDLFFIIIILLFFISGLIWEMLALFLALFIHELAHILTAHGLGYSIVSIEVLPFGGTIDIRQFRDLTSDLDLLVILAGPMANFVAAIFLMFLVSNNFFSFDLCRQFISRQLYLGFFNLLPALPLDGGRIFVLWLRQKVSFISAVKIAARTGRIIAFILIAIGIAGFLLKSFFIDFLIIGVFLFLESKKEEKKAPITFMKYTTKKKETLLKQGYLPIKSIVVINETPVKDVMYLFTPREYYLVYVLNEKMKVKDCLTESEIFNKIIEKGLDINIQDLL